jgi:hypothetical protein
MFSHQGQNQELVKSRLSQFILLEENKAVVWSEANPSFQLSALSLVLEAFVVATRHC